MDNKEAFISGYISCAMWSSTDTHPETGEYVNLDRFEISREAYETLSDYAGKAFDQQRILWDKFVEETGTYYSQAGQSFWLSTNGHGAGFFDFDFTDSEAAQKLDSMCNPYGHNGAIYRGFDLYIGDDGLVYV